VLSATRRHRYCVIEISGHGPRAVERASAFVRPDIAVVTRVGDDHYKNFRSRAATAAEKVRLVESLSEGGVAVLNADDPNVWAMRTRTRARVVGCGASAEAHVRLLSVDAAWPERLSVRVACADDVVTARSQLVGAYGVFPILAALAVARAEQIPMPEAMRAIATVEPLMARMCPHEVAGVTIIEDTQKAPLYTVPASLEFMRTARAKRKILVFGTVSDFSAKAGRTYRALAQQALEVTDVVAFVGPWATSVERLRGSLGADRLLAFASLADLNAHLKSLLQPGDLVMLKGSGGADHLERIVLDRTTSVACWRERCGRRHRCDFCELRLQPG
jgi:UDP-N-acetylmuramyl pentapeptide synthase